MPPSNNYIHVTSCKNPSNPNLLFTDVFLVITQVSFFWFFLQFTGTWDEWIQEEKINNWGGKLSDLVKYYIIIVLLFTDLASQECQSTDLTNALKFPPGVEL